MRKEYRQAARERLGTASLDPLRRRIFGAALRGSSNLSGTGVRLLIDDAA